MCGCRGKQRKVEQKHGGGIKVGMNIYNIYNIYCFPFCLCFNPITIVGAAAKPLLWKDAAHG